MESFGSSGVSPAEIRAFRTSMSARRFPALREMRDEDIAALVIANKKLHQKRLLGTKAGLAEVTNAPSRGTDNQVPTDAGFSFNQQPVDAFPAAPSKRRPAFSPCNPAKAKDDIMRKGAEPYLRSTVPYEKHATREEMRVQEAVQFVPNSASQAKTSISINYFLNSPDEQTLEQEKLFIDGRARKNHDALLRSGYGRVARSAKGVEEANEVMFQDMQLNHAQGLEQM